MRKPAFCPPPVFIFAGDGETLVEGDSIFAVRRSRYPIHDRARSVGVLVRPEEHVRRIAVTAANQKAHIERVPTQNPVELIPCVTAEF